MNHTYYFASRYDRNEEMRDYRDEFVTTVPGVVVTSRWIDCHGGNVPQSFEPAVLSADPEACWKYGFADLEDLAAARTLVAFTGSGGKGGRHVEYGIALALAKRIVIVGLRENIFHCAPDVEVHPTWSRFLRSERARVAQLNRTPG